MPGSVDHKAIEKNSGINISHLQEWMNARGIGQGIIKDTELLAGGTQNILMRFSRKGEFYVLRRPPLFPRPNSNESIRREVKVLSALKNTSVPHPMIIADETEDSEFGFAFYIMRWIDGFNVTNEMPALHASNPSIRFEMGMNLVRTAADLSKIDYVAVGLSDFGNVDNYLSRQVKRWLKQVEGYCNVEQWPGPDNIPGLLKVSDWLERYQPSTFSPGLMHGDFHVANVMFDRWSPKILAVIDWELSTLGDPLIDFAWLLVTWPNEDDEKGIFNVSPWQGFPTSREMVDCYKEISGRDLSSLDWYRVFACFKLGILLESTYVRACAGKVPMEKGKVMHDMTRYLFNQALSII